MRFCIERRGHPSRSLRELPWPHGSTMGPFDHVSRGATKDEFAHSSIAVVDGTVGSFDALETVTCRRAMVFVAGPSYRRAAARNLWILSREGVFSHQTALALHKASDSPADTLHLTLPVRFAAGERLLLPRYVRPSPRRRSKKDHTWLVLCRSRPSGEHSNTAHSVGCHPSSSARRKTTLHRVLVVESELADVKAALRHRRSAMTNRTYRHPPNRRWAISTSRPCAHVRRGYRRLASRRSRRLIRVRPDPALRFLVTMRSTSVFRFRSSPVHDTVRSARSGFGCSLPSSRFFHVRLVEPNGRPSSRTLLPRLRADHSRSSTARRYAAQRGGRNFGSAMQVVLGTVVCGGAFDLSIGRDRARRTDGLMPWRAAVRRTSPPRRARRRCMR